MLFQAWRTALLEAFARHTAGAGEPQDRYEQTLSDLYWLMREAPSEAHDVYEALDEDWLGDAARTRAAELGREKWPLALEDPNAVLQSCVEAVAVEARAADLALAEVRSAIRPADPNIDWRAPGETGVFVVPLSSASRSQAAGGAGKPFSRRGVLHHRLIPTEAGGVPVRLVLPDLHGPGDDGGDALLGAALFPNVSFKISLTQNDSCFVIAELENEDEMEAELLRQIKLIDDGPRDDLGCLVAVWPELTISPKLLAVLRRELASRGLDEDGRPVGFVLAGSWHEPTGGRIRNLTHVLDAAGRPLCTYSKMRPFKFKGLPEDLEPGQELPILVYGDQLIGLAICKDFCDLAKDTAYHHLPLDLVLVPSYGDDKTLRSHMHTAKSLRVRHDTRVFVVQQGNPPPEGGSGYVLPPLDDPLAPSVKECVQAELWRTHLRLKR